MKGLIALAAIALVFSALFTVSVVSAQTESPTPSPSPTPEGAPATGLGGS